jgi:hypothetical protein
LVLFARAAKLVACGRGFWNICNNDSRVFESANYLTHENSSNSRQVEEERAGTIWEQTKEENISNEPATKDD